MTTTFDEVLADFGAEAAALAGLLAEHSEADFSLATPAKGWDVADQIIHLGLFDRRCAWSIADPERFRQDRAALATKGGLDRTHAQMREMPLQQLLAWWREGGAELQTAAAAADPRARCEWYGPSMSVTSMLTARIMETWAHGYDIADAWSVVPHPTDRLFHIAHIAVRARQFAYTIHHREVPDRDVRVELTAPSGVVWTWGPEDAVDGLPAVRGSALGFCLAATQRRHVNDCGLEIVGDEAREWMSIIQAFAGPPGAGRAEGQFDAL